MAQKGNTVSIDALRPEIWQKELYADVMDNLYFTQNGMMGKDVNNIIQIKDELMKGKGDKITFGLTAKLSGDGVTGDDELEGNEEKVLSYSESIEIDQWRTAVRSTGALDDQKVAYDARMDAKEKLSIRLQEFIERQFFLKLAGVSNTSLTDIAGDVVGTLAAWSNTPDYIPDAHEAAGYGARYLCAASGGTTALGTTHKLTPSLIQKAKVKAMLAKPKILPLKIKGKNYYLMFIHPWQANDLKDDPTFYEARKDAEVRGKDNPIFSGALGVWDGVILHEHEYVPFLDVSVAGNSFRGAAVGTDCAVDCFRALLCGKQAAAFAQCKYNKGWVEKDFDYGNKWGIKSGILGGIQKVMFNSKEYGVIAVDTYATPIN